MDRATSLWSKQNKQNMRMVCFQRLRAFSRGCLTVVEEYYKLWRIPELAFLLSALATKEGGVTDYMGQTIARLCATTYLIGSLRFPFPIQLSRNGTRCHSFRRCLRMDFHDFTCLLLILIKWLWWNEWSPKKWLLARSC